MNQNKPTPIGKILPKQEKRMLTMPADFEQTTLTQQEINELIYEHRCEKYFREQALKKKERERQEFQECLRPFTTGELREHVLKNNPHFRVDPQCEKVFDLLCRYFANDPEFEESGYSLSKGILLTGPVGVGKTEMLRIFEKNKRQCFQLISVYQVEAACQKHGVEFFQVYIDMVPGWGNSPEFFFQRSVGWAFDDLGRESVVFDFGNKSDVISKIIQTRYLDKKNVPFNSLHLTTNLTPAEIETRYDYAVKSRLREMFNYIPVEGKDRR